jgi:hypothetical protein
MFALWNGPMQGTTMAATNNVCLVVEEGGMIVVWWQPILCMGSRMVAAKKGWHVT